MNPSTPSLKGFTAIKSVRWMALVEINTGEMVHGLPVDVGLIDNY